jgi:hypothetical protein
MKSFEDALSLAYLSTTKIALILPYYLLCTYQIGRRQFYTSWPIVRAKSQQIKTLRLKFGLSCLLDFACFGVHGPDLHPAICLVARFCQVRGGGREHWIFYKDVESYFMLKRYLDGKGELGDWAGRNTIKAPHWGWKRRQDLILIGKL